MKINTKNASKLNAAIDKVESRASVRLISADMINSEIRNIGTRLSMLNIAKKHWVGMNFCINVHSAQFSGMYRGMPAATIARVERCPSGWFVTAIYRGDARDRRVRFTNESRYHYLYQF